MGLGGPFLTLRDHRARYDAGKVLMAENRLMGMPNDLLRAEREAQGLSQQDLADSIQQHEYATTGKELPVDKSYVSKWERGAKDVSDFYADRLVAVLGKSRAELGLKDRPSRRSAASAKLGATPATDESRDVQRRQFNRLVRDLASGLTAEPLMARLVASRSAQTNAQSGLVEGEAWERTVAALRRPGRVDEKIVQALEAVTVSHRRI
jgi:transcriptional regulator with XRE-family HTH domain